MKKRIEPQGPLLSSRTAFLGDFTFPSVGIHARHAALAEIRRSASWDEREAELALSLPWRISEAKPEDMPRLAESARHVRTMLEQVCTRGAKYQVAAETLIQRVDELERELQRVRRAVRR